MEQRNKHLGIRLTNSEYDTIISNAEKSGFPSASDYVREVAVKGTKTVFYDPEVDAEIRHCHEEFRRVSDYVQRLVEQADPSNIGNTIACNNAESQILKLNCKLRYIQESLRELKENTLNGDNETDADQAE